jgi:hypothetical protein
MRACCSSEAAFVHRLHIWVPPHSNSGRQWAIHTTDNCDDLAARQRHPLYGGPFRFHVPFRHQGCRPIGDDRPPISRVRRMLDRQSRRSCCTMEYTTSATSFCLAQRARASGSHDRGALCSTRGSEARQYPGLAGPWWIFSLCRAELELC